MSQKNQQFLAEYQQSPEALKLVLGDVSRHGYNSAYDNFKRTYVRGCFSSDRLPLKRHYDDVGVRSYTQQILGSYTLAGVLLSFKGREAIDSNHRNRDFFLATADLNTRQVTEWEMTDPVFSGSGAALKQEVTGASSMGEVNLVLTSQGCELNGEPLGPLAELENRLSYLHYHYGHAAIRACLLGETEDPAIVAA